MSTTDDVRRVDPATGLPIEYDDDLDNSSSSSDEQLSELDDDLVDTSFLDARSERAPDTQPATLIRCNVDRMYLIAKQYGIANFKRMKKAALYNVIFSAMSANTDCDSCNEQCDPSTHVFLGVTVKSPIRTRGKAKTALPSSTGTSGTQPGLNSGSSLHDVLLGNQESNFVPDQDVPLLLRLSSVTQLTKALPPPGLQEDEELECAHRQEILQVRGTQPISNSSRRTVTNAAPPAAATSRVSSQTSHQNLANPGQSSTRSSTRSQPSQPSRGTQRNVSWRDDLESVRTYEPDQRGRAESTSALPSQNFFESMMNAAVENHFRGRSASTGALQLPTDLGPASAGSGKLSLISTPNMQMARRLGVHPHANLRVEGSTTRMDVTKLAKYLTSGANKKGPIVTRQATYPEDCLTDVCPLYDTPKLALTDLDLPQFVFGFLNMALCETLAEDLDPILANKIHFVQYMISNSFSLEWSHLIKTTHSWQSVGAGSRRIG